MMAIHATVGEWTNEEAIITVASFNIHNTAQLCPIPVVAIMMRGSKRNHQVKPSFRGNYPVYERSVPYLNCITLVPYLNNCPRKYIIMLHINGNSNLYAY